MLPMRGDMDWKQYECEITDQFKRYYPAAKITPNAKLIGRFSKVERQINILVEEQAGGRPFRA